MEAKSEKPATFLAKPAIQANKAGHTCLLASAMQTFARRLEDYLHGIVARCRHPLNTSIVEGINNAIKVIKRRAYGYRDEEYFFLKIRAAFPGIPR